MRKATVIHFSLVAGLAIVCACFFMPGNVFAKNVSETAKDGNYQLTLKVLPAEAFKGPDVEMVRDGGAMANTLGGADSPNHHLVVFVKENDRPVETANVTIRYRRLSSEKEGWMSLPVARMHVKSKGMATTHYGNNVELGPGSYEARVTVNGQGPATFHFSL